MRILIPATAAAIMLSGCATYGGDGYSDGYYYGNQRYATYDECVRAKNSGRNTGAVVGAVAGGAAAAAAGGNLGETAAAAGAGALAGAVIGKGARRC